MSTSTLSNGLPIAVGPGQKLLGEIVTWSATGITIDHVDLIDALREYDLDEKVARQLAPRHAFSRACKKLSEDRIIRQVSEDDQSITFQFTREEREEDRFAYALETILTLNKTTGEVQCDLPGLATLAQEELDRCISLRNGGDITRIVQKLFEQRTDLFPIRPQGGAYFVVQEHTDFCDRIEKFLSRLNARMHRFPIPAGTPHGDRSVKASVASGLEALIAEHHDAIKGFGEDTRASTLERAADRIRLTRHKIEAYACYLVEEKGRLEKALSKATLDLRCRIESLADEEDATLSTV